MAREWQGVASNYVSMSDLGTGLRCERSTAYTGLAFIAPRPGIDERAFWSKDDRQILMEVEKSAEGGSFRIYSGGSIILTSVLSPMVTDRWYLAGVTCDGTETANDGHMFLIDLTDGSVKDDTDFTMNADNGDLTGNNNFGSLRSDANNEYDGGIFCVSYFTRQFTLQDVKNYSISPFRTMLQYQSDCVFFLPMPVNASPEPDWSGQGNNGTVTGTDYGIVGNPPVAPWIGFYDVKIPLAVAAVDLVELRKQIFPHFAPGYRRTSRSAYWADNLLATPPLVFVRTPPGGLVGI